ncbi:molybdopterin cofactor-binding domain-containing protein [Tropicibacter naphthalenivorans]|uniref:Xanthine dehydrogenase molybdenum-binding subunit n=1 Tax=Tropicibacter naphthalenivorans TaxID=441103 RepID=A0A0P1H1K0_9RHOB|nr:molybdopterin cofactor-binding domain-containing protein [Tropicibacter naphthalenivorans]CUH80750.1 Xanthine dehydrogenase molybdenum-binding subunit [Tropicibacter naphthalenivorans]SMC89981.1 xanthine dehydrogenase/oxidase [Tropicibacter naphthalenivorans]
MTDNVVKFYLNGKQVEIANPSPDLLLIDYLKSPQVNLSGPKKPCGQGGCGGCTVILSDWDAEKGAPNHRAINSCLRPVTALNGLAVTTVEGTGTPVKPTPARLSHNPVFGWMAATQSPDRPADLPEVAKALDAHMDALADILEDVDEAITGKQEHGGMNKVAHTLAANNGTQCGYCSVGFVMNMTEFFANNPQATQREVEAALDGNLCRCTGYRAILSGMKSLASDWTEADAAAQMPLKLDHEAQVQIPATGYDIPFPDGAKAPATPAQIEGNKLWLVPRDLDKLRDMMGAYPEARLVQANTSYGVYKDEYLAADVLIDLSAVPDLNHAPQLSDCLTVPASITYSQLIEILQQAMTDLGQSDPDATGEARFPSTTPLGAVHYMARRTAGRLVRNAATLGGNLMLVAHHIAAGEPFPSDAATALVGVGAQVEWMDFAEDGVKTTPLGELYDLLAQVPEFARRVVILNVQIPTQPGAFVSAHKTALREVNSHSLVNACTRICVDDQGIVTEAYLVFGGILPLPWAARATQEALLGRPLSLEMMGEIATLLLKEVSEALDATAPRMEGLPSENIPNAYKAQLATSFLYKAVVAAQSDVPPEVASAGQQMWGNWPISKGHQDWESDKDWERQPVGDPYIKYLAMEQTAGKLRYTHELPTPNGTLYASLVQSTKPLGMFRWVHPETGADLTAGALSALLAAQFPAFQDLITCDDVPKGGINLQGMGADQPLFSTGAVVYVGQALALIGASGPQEAETIAEFVTQRCVAYGPITYDGPDWWDAPVLTLDKAIELGSIYPDYPSSAPFVSHIWRITRPGSVLDWMPEANAAPVTVEADTLVGNIACTVVSGAHSCGGQAHFYMEPQAVLVEPGDAHSYLIHPSTQSPQEMHQTSAMALGAQYNHIEVKVPPVGGGFGGKTEQTRFVVGPAMVAAAATDRPVKLALTREQDTSMIGKRHGYKGHCTIALDQGDIRPEDRGRIRGQSLQFWGDGGAFYDCSFIVSNCLITRADNAYSVPNYQAQIDVCRTNTAPSTAMRSFGDIQSKVIVEAAIDDAAHALGMRGEDVREKSLYTRGEVTPFGQALPECYIREVWHWLKDKCDFDAKVAEVEAFNTANRWRKRGVAMLPVKYGSGYNLPLLEQATATVSIYQADGTVVIHQSGVEMGQGLLTVARQVVALVLNIPMDMVRVENANTSVTPNPTSSGGSTGTSYNAEAVKQLGQQMRTRISSFVEELRLEHGDGWCKRNQIDYWNHEGGWNAVVKTPDGQHKLIWSLIVAQAYQARVNLTASFNAVIQGGTTEMPNVTYKPLNDQPKIPGYTGTDGQPGSFTQFCGWTYSAAASVVEVDVLTGETKVISSDIAYDMGMSLNPAIDIGQIEGAFVQGIGYVLTERLAFQPDGPNAGTLNSVNTWRYKIPATTTIPLEMNTHLFPRSEVPFPLDPMSGVLSSKEVGEPPLVLATSVFLALRNAVRASRVERGLDPYFTLDAPATVDAVSAALGVTPEQFAT